jgi:hypothetical protein
VDAWIYAPAAVAFSLRSSICASSSSILLRASSTSAISMPVPHDGQLCSCVSFAMCFVGIESAGGGSSTAAAMVSVLPSFLWVIVFRPLD